MANIFNKFLDSMKLNDDDDDYDDDYEYEDEYEDDDDFEEEKPKKSIFHREKKEPVYDDEPEAAPEPAPVKQTRKASNVVPMRSAGKAAGLEVCMVKPNTLNDGREIVDTLLKGSAVVINMEGIPTETAQKIIDFTSGACYATDGNMQKISNYIFICTPPSVNLSGDFQELMGSAAGIEE